MPERIDREKKTDRIPNMEKCDRITVDFGDPESAAQFLEQVAFLIRNKGKLTVWVD